MSPARADTSATGSTMARWLIRAAVSATAVAILLRIIPLPAVLAALARVSVWTWAVSVGIFFAGHFANALKMRLLLGPPAASFSSCVRAQYAGLAANLALPGLAGGDLVRAAYLAPAVGTKRAALAGVADRVIDTLTLVALIVVALPFAGVPPGLDALVMRTEGWILGGAAVAAAVALVAWRLRMRRPAWDPLVLAFAQRSAVAAAVAISWLVQSTFVMTNVWLARQVGVSTGAAPWFVAWPLSKLIALVPISLGGLGVREAALVSLLTPYGAPRDAVLASGILWQAVLTVTGLAGLLVTQLLPRLSSPPAAIESPSARA